MAHEAEIRAFEDAIVLYHGSPHRLTELVPATNAGTEYWDKGQVFVSPNRSYAAPYALATSPGRNPMHMVDHAIYPRQARNEGYMHRIVLHRGDPLPHHIDARAPQGAADPSYFRAGKRYTWEEVKELEKEAKKRKHSNPGNLVFDEPVKVQSSRKISKKEVKKYGVKISKFRGTVKPFYYRVVNGKKIKVRNSHYKGPRS